MPTRALAAIREAVALKFGFMTERVIGGQPHIVDGNVSPPLFEQMKRAVLAVTEPVRLEHSRVAQGHLLPYLARAVH